MRKTILERVIFKIMPDYYGKNILQVLFTLQEIFGKISIVARFIITSIIMEMIPQRMLYNFSRETTHIGGSFYLINTFAFIRIQFFR